MVIQLGERIMTSNSYSVFNAMVDIGRQNIENKTYKANVGRHWGKATVTKNWKEKIKI